MFGRIVGLAERAFVHLSFVRDSGWRAEEIKVARKGLGATEDGDPFDLSGRDLARHLYVLGATGSGKTTFILGLLAKDLAAGRSVIVLDLRGDLALGTLGLCAALGVDPARVRSLDLRRAGPSWGFDPLAGAGEPFVRALHLLDVVRGEAESWGVQLEETLRNALLVLAEAGEPVTRIEEFLHEARFREACLSRVADPALRTYWERFGEIGEEKRNVRCAPVTNKLAALLAVPRLRRVLEGKPDLGLEDLMGTPGSVLTISLAMDELHGSARMLGSLLVSAIAREAMARVDVPAADRNPVRLYVDEFENMASEAFEGLIAEGRRFGLSLVLSHQTLTQLPARLRSVVRNNAGTQVFFGLGIEDAREMARETPDGIEVADLRSLKPGEAYLTTREGGAERVTFHSRPSGASGKVLDAYLARLREALPPPIPETDATPKTEDPPDDSIRPDPEDWL